MEIGISVIVCCYNSAEILPYTIRYLANQKINRSIRWEIVIVNNASTDNTKEIAIKELRKYHNATFNYNIIDQPIKGLSYARKSGAENSRYKYLIFCDDDNWLYNDYIEKAFTLIDSDETIGIIGGSGIGESDIEFPPWWEDYKADYAVGEQSNCDGELTGFNYIWGAGMVTRKDLFLKAFKKKFPPLLTGRNGIVLTSGEDTEYNIRARLLGYKTIYSKSLTYIHFIKKERLTVEYRQRLKEGFKDVWSIITEYEIQTKLKSYTIFQKITELIRIIKRICKNLILLDFFKNHQEFDNLFRITRIPLGYVKHETKIIAYFISNAK